MNFRKENITMNKIVQPFVKKYVIMVVAIIMLAVFTTGCEGKVYLTTGLNADQLLKVSGQVVPMSLAKLVLASERNNYSNELGEDVWNIDFEKDDITIDLKQKVKYQLAELKTISLLAKEKNITLSDDEKKSVSDAAEEYFESLSEKEIDGMNLKKEDVEDLYEMFLIAEKFYRLTTENVFIEISDEEARVVKAQYIFVKTYYEDDNGQKQKMKKDELATSKKRIEEAKDRIATGTDFIVIAKEYSDDSIYEYEFDRGKMEKAFEDAAFSLDDGEVSDIIEGESGFYIIRIVKSYDEMKTEENKKDMLLKYKNSEFMKVYKPFLENQTFEYNDKDYNDIDIKEIVLDNNKLYEIYAKHI